jgi:hypothetical protein
MITSQQDVMDALAHLYPAGFTAFDPGKPTPASYAEYLDWCEAEPHTEAELIAAAETTRERRAILHSRREARAAIRAMWATVPDWMAAPFQEKFEAANALLDQGRDGAAVALVQYAEAPAAFEPLQLTTFENLKTTLITQLQAIPAIP